MATNRPHSPQPSPGQEQLIDDLGGPTVVANVVSRRIGLSPALSPQAVSMWRKRGIPYRYRGVLVVEARERNINVPANFFGTGEEPVPAAPTPVPAITDEVPEWLQGDS